MSSYGFGYDTTLGTISWVDRYSNYATQSLDNAEKLSGASRDQLKSDFHTYVPEASAAYFVDIKVPDEEE